MQNEVRMAATCTRSINRYWDPMVLRRLAHPQMHVMSGGLRLNRVNQKCVSEGEYCQLSREWKSYDVY